MKKVRCVNLGRNKVHTFSEKVITKDWFKKGGWKVEDLSVNELVEEKPHSDLPLENGPSNESNDFSVQYPVGANAKTTIEKLGLCETLAEVEAFKVDARSGVKKAVEKRVKELSK